MKHIALFTSLIACSAPHLIAQSPTPLTGATSLEAFDALTRPTQNDLATGPENPNITLIRHGVPSIFPTPHHVKVGTQKVTVAQIEFIEADMPEEAYELALNEQGLLRISYSSETGRFYAVQTLSQMLGQTQAHLPVEALSIKGKTLPTFTIKDAPDVALRGVVEGFYGQPWSHEARLSQLRFYGRNKLNTYIFGPKDDPYHSAQWRIPYPSEEAAKIEELARVAKENHVKFYWAIHPGHSIKWTDEDMHNVIKKFELMYDLGVRHFAVFFDDIFGEGTKPEMQAKLMQMILDEFVKVKGDVGELLICPTQYNKAWSSGNYLPLLGTELDPSVHIMWTGNTVVHDISLSGQQWINEKIKRPAFIWWNSPCTDYVRDHLCLGRVYGLDQDPAMVDALGGFTSNPMDKPEASKIALFGVADYTWNVVQSNSHYSWVAGITRQFAEYAPAMYVFAQHNSDPGVNNHGYRREESASIAPAIKLVLEGAQNPPMNQVAWKKANLEMSYLRTSSTKLQQCALPAIEEIRPWLQNGAYLGEAAESILYTVLPDEEGKLGSNLEAQLTHFVKASYALTKFTLIDSTINQQRDHQGIKVGSLHIMPMVEKLMARFDSLYMQKITEGEHKAISVPTAPSAKSSIKGFETMQVVQSKDKLSIRPILEVHEIPAGGSIEIHIPAKSPASRATIDLADKELASWAKVQMRDEKNELYATKVDKNPKESIFEYVRKDTAGEKVPCMGLKITNTSDSAKSIKVSQVSLDIPKTPAYADSISLQDGKLSTALLITPDRIDQPLTIACPKGAKEVILIGQLRAKISGTSGDKSTIELIEEAHQVQLKLKSGAKSITLTPSEVGIINEVIFR